MERSPTLTLLVVFVVVYVVQSALGFVGVASTAFALASPIDARPWTLVTSVYAHSTVPHLVANCVALALVGLFLERRTSRLRFHAFFLFAGIVAGVAQVWVGLAFGNRVAVIGASGAIFALVGYLVAGNRVADSVLGNLLGARAQFALALVVAGGLTFLTRGAGVALVAHFTGLLVGLAAGRTHLLRP
jgi:membrane associated rhomboid family serine protease